MALQADLLESIPQTKYLSAESYISYRAIMRTFYLEYQKMHYQLDKDTILSLLHRDSLFATYTMEQLISDLDQLVRWKNLTPIQDPHKAYTIADFKNRQFQYMMTEAALEVERRLCQSSLRKRTHNVFLDGKANHCICIARAVCQHRANFLLIVSIDPNSHSNFLSV